MDSGLDVRCSNYSDMFRFASSFGTRNDNATSRFKSVLVRIRKWITPDMEMESLLRGVSSGQPQLFAEIARSHDLRALPEQRLWCFSSPVLGGHVVSAFRKFEKCIRQVPCGK
jgi:hypothetical protein